MALTKKGLRFPLPFNFGRVSSTRFSMFTKVRSSSSDSGEAPVYLNVYDLTPVNGYVFWAGIGIFHSGVEVHGVEYAFGAHDYPISGVFEVEPRRCPGFKFRKSVLVGTTALDPIRLREFMELQSVNYNGDTYHLIVKNCNHFCEDMCAKLTGNAIPKWVNRLARIGAICNFILPDSLKVHGSNGEAEDHEKESLNKPFSCFSSLSMSQKEQTAASLPLFSSPSKLFCSWDLKRASSKRVKEE